MDKTYEHSENWKSKEVSIRQLELNLRELSSPESYPEHWVYFLQFVRSNGFKNVLDVGCGVGAYYQLIKNNTPQVNYIGIDYSEDAIEIAKKNWEDECFICMDYKQMDRGFINDFDLVHMGAFISVLANGNEALDYVLSLEPRNVLISRIDITKTPSSFGTYKAYDLIDTYSFFINDCELDEMVKKRGYEQQLNKKNLFLKRIK